jgi:hypothetical protein
MPNVFGIDARSDRTIAATNARAHSSVLAKTDAK